MKATLVFVPPDGGEADYSLDFELPNSPQSGDYISITRPGEQGTSDFIVRRSWWSLEHPSNELYGISQKMSRGTFASLMVECEFAKGPRSTESHVRACEMYKNRNGKLKEFEDTAY